MADTGGNGTEAPEGGDQTRTQKTSEFVLLLRDKEALKTALDEKEKALNSAMSTSFELYQKIDKLETELKALKGKGSKSETKDKIQAPSASPAAGNTPVSTPKNGRKVRPKTAKHANPRQKPRKGLKPPVEIKVEVAKEAEKKDTYKYYEEIAQTYPDLKLSVLLVAEKKFVQADSNKDGTIDADELDRILESSSLLFTKQQVRDIVKQIDADGSSDLDFMECLAVIDRLHRNKKSNLPTALEQNKSTVCSIQ
ncbi:uncharacterized protein LOC117298627 [Asterias rubens]|uniref:uncharacterized protein LOC117298627 n=1 Tax=Asterias rubens TaxID=7604 RepID=UPI00145530AB|nr:uncharacterized protein LOC117298627 [Asterias rubens]